MDRENPGKTLVTTSVIAANIQAGYHLNRSTTSPRQPTAQNHALSQITRPFFFYPPKSQIHAIINYLKIQFEPHRKHSTISIININWLCDLESNRCLLWDPKPTNTHTTLVKGRFLMTHIVQATWTAETAAHCPNKTNAMLRNVFYRWRTSWRGSLLHPITWHPVPDHHVIRMWGMVDIELCVFVPSKIRSSCHQLHPPAALLSGTGCINP